MEGFTTRLLKVMCTLESKPWEAIRSKECWYIAYIIIEVAYWFFSILGVWLPFGYNFLWNGWGCSQVYLYGNNANFVTFLSFLLLNVGYIFFFLTTAYFFTIMSDERMDWMEGCNLMWGIMKLFLICTVGALGCGFGYFIGHFPGVVIMMIPVLITGIVVHRAAAAIVYLRNHSQLDPNILN